MSDLSLASVEKMNSELSAADPSLLSNDAVLAAVLEGSGDCIKILDLDGRLQFMSEGGKRVMEVDDFSALQGCPWPDLWADEGNFAARDAIEHARDGRTSRFLGQANTAKGNPKYWDVRVMPIRGKEGKPTHLLSISTDITESRTADETIGRLMREATDAAAAETRSLRQLLKDAPSFMCVLRGPEHRFELMNDAYFQLVGHRPMVGMTVREGLPELEGQGFYELLDDVYRTGETFSGRGLEIDLQRTPDAPMEKAFMNFVYQPIRDEDGTITGIFVEGSDITDQKKAELALRENEVLVRMALTAANMGVWQCKVIDGRFVDLKGDERAITLLGGIPGVQSTFEGFVARIHDEDRDRLTTAAAVAMDVGGDGILDVDYRVGGRNGEADRWVHARAQVIPSGNGKRLIGTVRDVTHRKEAEALQAVLSAEMQHRVKNTLAVVSAIATQTFKGDDVADRRLTFASRMQALATAQEVLLAKTRKSASLRSVVENALAPHMSGRDDFEISGPTVDLDAKQSLSIALAIHELATNAAKYGALSIDSGKVHIDWSTKETNDRGERIFRLTWQETGGPPVIEPASKGFGSRLINRVLPADFNGSVRIDYEPGGVVCNLVSPVSSVIDRVSCPMDRDR